MSATSVMADVVYICFSGCLLLGLPVASYVCLLPGMHVSALSSPSIFFAHPSGEEDLMAIHMRGQEPFNPVPESVLRS
jgi:hypothetical protein